MPELPEVETICWRLREGGHGEGALVGRVIAGAHITDPKVLRRGDLDAVVGGRVAAVERRAKWIVVVVDTAIGAGRTWLLVHLKMTGDLHVKPADDEVRFERWRLSLAPGPDGDDLALIFTDPRRFGHLDVLPEPPADLGFFDDLGPEPLADSFTPAVLRAALRGKRAIKATLLDQKVLAGIGNIYADEALFLAGIDPQSRTVDVAADESAVVRLHAGLQQALQESITASRQELAWRYENRTAPSPFRVYERAGLACLRCGAPLSSTTLAGRTTVWCGTCQKRL